MNNTFENTLQNSELAQVIFSYIHKNLRNDVSYIIYKDNSILVEQENKLEKYPENTIGIIDHGIFLPI